MTRLLVVRETAEGEARVAASPETVKKLKAADFEVVVEQGAGLRASFTDARFEEAGARLAGDRDAALAEADIVLTVQGLSAEDCAKLKAGAQLVGFLDPFGADATLRTLAERKLTGVSMEMVPRISRAQSMDALSSQASIAGYKAVLLAAASLDKYCPLLMTAAGTIQPARVVIMGAGVAGLQAIATARRLGAVVEVSDIRPAVKEQVESLGGRFIDVPLEEGGEDAGGYAKAVSEDFLKKQQAIVRERVIAADIVITTALVPGRKAPRLITAEMVQSMREGAVIVDLAITHGGNCELSEAGESVQEGVRILAPLNIAATMALDASQLYARNVLALLQHYQKTGLDFEDAIVAGATLVHGGEIRHPAVRERLGLGAAEAS